MINPIPAHGTCYGVYDSAPGVSRQVARINRHKDGDFVCSVAFIQPDSGRLGSWMEPAKDELFIGGNMFATIDEAIAFATAFAV